VYALGPGKADLLEAVAECASIAGAGRALGYSYWKTRHLLDEMNACFRAPVVETLKGGKSGGGAVLTETGRQALALFRAMEAKALAAIQEEVAAVGGLLASPFGKGDV
jgi:molybdate transport system regulatory protein